MFSVTGRRVAIRAMWVLLLTLVITGVSYIQPGARVEADEVPISELVGQTPMYPQSSIIINETEGTFLLVDESGIDRLVANYTPPLVGPYMEFLSNSGVSITVERSTSQSVETGMLVIVSAALIIAMAISTALIRRDPTATFFGQGASRRTPVPAARRRLH